jgi:hypothetical protein
VHRIFAKQLLQRRIIALATAYVLALSGLIGGFGAARAAAAASAIPGAVTCHSEIGGRQAPSGGERPGTLCVDSCCIGCLMLMAALPPPPDIAAGEPQLSGRKLTLIASVGFARIQNTGSHQSRGPPNAA